MYNIGIKQPSSREGERERDIYILFLANIFLVRMLSRVKTGTHQEVNLKNDSRTPKILS